MKKQKRLRYFAVFMILNIVFETISPTMALALTSGPSQPEFMGFEPAGSNEMVDLFTGDFKYNIPLMDVDGYPLNLSYHAGSTMESEASWVGLGWSLSPGVLNRMMKGLPDDFKGDEVKQTTRIKPFVSKGLGKHTKEWSNNNYSISFFGPLAGKGYGDGTSKTPSMIIYNNYKGFGVQEEYDSHSSVNQSLLLYTTTKGSFSQEIRNSQDGSTFGEGTVSGAGYNFLLYSRFQNKMEGKTQNTRTGASMRVMGSSRGGAVMNLGGRGVTRISAIPSGNVSYSPKIPYNLSGGGISRSDKIGFWSKISVGINVKKIKLAASFTMGELTGYKYFANSMKIHNAQQTLKSYGFLYSEAAKNTDLMDFNRFRDEATFEETPNTSYANATYDLFFASAQGMSSTFRPFRSDIGVVHDPQTTLHSVNEHSGVELGGPVIAYAFKEESTVETRGNSDVWISPFYFVMSFRGYNNRIAPLQSALAFEESTRLAYREKTYFKELGDLSAKDEDYEASVLHTSPVRPLLVKVGGRYEAFSPIHGKGRQKRDIRKNYIRSLTAREADLYGTERKINLYDQNSFTLDAGTRHVSTSSLTTNINISRTLKNSVTAPGGPFMVQDHLSEVSMTNSSGDRYIYGIPAYNLYTKKVLFNASARKEGSYIIRGQNIYPNPISYTSDPLNMSDACQLIQYQYGLEVDNNRRGKDNLSRVEEMPAYASSFLLTSILSPDYVDVTGNGPSYDDLGGYTKFNYSKSPEYQWRTPYCLDPAVSGTLAGNISAATSQAHFEEGLISDPNDNKAFYHYGIRENYYVHSIESKNYVAFFQTSPRSDAMGVTAENGSKGSSGESLRLDAITLYSKSEILAKGGLSNAIPIKTVHFEYDYSLCPGTFNTLTNDNPNRGKLTLKKVYFTYGSSKKASLSPYEFRYADNDHDINGISECNFPYNPTSVDRWGNYKPNSGTPTGTAAPMSLNNTEFPYAEQNKALADQYAAAWNLTEIRTPSGSSIRVTYEADDYTYVQNQRAAQMCRIFNYMSVFVPVTPNTDVLSSYSGGAQTTNLKEAHEMILDLSSLAAGIPTTVPIQDANNILKDRMLEHGLYYKCFLEVFGMKINGQNYSYHDYVSGYSPTFSSSMFSAAYPNNTYTSTSVTGETVSCYRFAKLVLESHPINPQSNKNNRKVNPISYGGWTFLRNENPALAYPGSEPSNIGDPTRSPQDHHTLAESGLACAKEDLLYALYKVPHQRFYDQNYCNTMYNAKSFVRLYSPGYHKLGGGHRVKRITSEDRWKEMTDPINTSGYGEKSTIYTQEFDYTTRNGNDTESSGVASYEPLEGGDENSLKWPVGFTIKKPYAPNDELYQERPLNEMLYPAPVVGYGKVTIHMLPDESSKSSGNGKTEFEFYTARDFPIRDITTDLYRTHYESLSSRLSIKKFINTQDNPFHESSKIFSSVQGSMVKLNDMHGKLRSVANYGENNPDVPVSKTEYLYKCTRNPDGNDLISTALTIDEHNTIATRVIARDIDVTADSRQNINTTTTTGTTDLFEMGLNITPVFYTPYIMITPEIPFVLRDKLSGSMELGYRGATITKVVQEYGILDKVISTYRGSTSTTENKLWDANTGNVLLTRVTNGYDEPVYHFNYPAYWRYHEMGHEFKRDGIVLHCPQTASVNPIYQPPLDVSTGALDGSQLHDPLILTVGDEVLVTDVSTGNTIGDRFWVIRAPMTQLSAHSYLLVDRAGKTLSTANYTMLTTSHDYDLKLIRPINRNKLDASMGQVSSLTDPYNPTLQAIDYSQGSPRILHATAQEYCSSGSIYENPAYTAPSQKETNVVPNSYSAVINPVIAGAYGDHKPTSGHQYRAKREYGSQPSKTDGYYDAFSPFWDYFQAGKTWEATAKSGCNTPTGLDRWVSAGGNMFYSPYGPLLESHNAIGIKSSSRYGFQHTLPVLNAYNAAANEVGFDSFEEYAQIYPSLQNITSYTASVYNNDYLGFYKATLGGNTPSITSQAAHTGRHSLFFGPGQAITLKHDVNRVTERPLSVYADDDYCACRQTNDAMNNARLSLRNKPYLLSMWVKGSSQSLDYSPLVSLSVTCVYSGSTMPTSTYTPVKSPVVNGWQKLDFEIDVPAPVFTPSYNSSFIDISISSGSGGGFYMDDFRIQPFNASMNCFVYDPYQLRIWAELDDRNYATIYEYDQEGLLVRKKKETQKTIYTLNESRSGLPKR